MRKYTPNDQISDLEYDSQIGQPGNDEFQKYDFQMGQRWWQKYEIMNFRNVISRWAKDGGRAGDDQWRPGRLREFSSTNTNTMTL